MLFGCCLVWIVVGHDAVGDDMAAGGTHSLMSTSFLSTSGEDIGDEMSAVLMTIMLASGKREEPRADLFAAAHLLEFHAVSALIICGSSSRNTNSLVTGEEPLKALLLWAPHGPRFR